MLADEDAAMGDYAQALRALDAAARSPAACCRGVDERREPLASTAATAVR